MKYTIEGYSQRELLRRRMDAHDVVLLQWFHEQFTLGMKKIRIAGREWALLEYENVCEELPILGLASKDSLYRRMKKLTDANVLESSHDPESKRTVYRLNEKAIYALVTGGERESSVETQCVPDLRS
ncbi:MAG TPA: hypothetical protein VMW73_02700 [Spirochaetia bacterium]|nr:hypothetical protein [Spirochaetia bacterium]